MADPEKESNPYRVKNMTFASGERFCSVVDADGMLEFGPTAYALVVLRGRECAASTMEAHMRAVALALEWAAKKGVDLAALTSSVQMLSPTQIHDLRDHLRASARKESQAAAGKDVGGSPVVKGGTYRTRCLMVRDYLAWFATRAIHAIRTDDPKLVEARLRLERFERAMAANLPKARSVPREPLGEEALALFLQVIRPDDPRNPFKAAHRHRNHALLLLYYETGARRGEVLKVKGENVKVAGRKARVAGDGRAGPGPEVQFRRNPDDPRDTRVREPNVKTQPHDDPISDELAAALRVWITEHRPDEKRYPGASKCPYVFMSRKGKPISARTVNHMFALLSARFKELAGLFPHLLRHAANERFSLGAESLGLSEAEETQARNLKFGWAKDSKQGALYNRRHVRRNAEKVMLRVQDLSVQGLNR